MNNLGFIYLFLPAAAIVYYLTPRFLKTGWLLFAALLFYQNLQHRNLIDQPFDFGPLPAHELFGKLGYFAIKHFLIV